MEGSRVLVVEDEEIIGQLVKDVLERSGNQVILAKTVAEGLEQVSQSSFSLCISDFMLPDKTGLHFSRAAKESAPELRIILVTAYLEPEIRREVEAEPNIIEVMRKPMDVFELGTRVEELLALGADGAHGAEN